MDNRNDFTDMKVWQDAHKLAISVYEDFKTNRDYSFCDQIKRATVSISNNIAEGAERSTPKEFARFLDIAKGSVGEVRSMYFLAKSLKFVTEEIAHERTRRCIEISKQLAGFAIYLRNK